MSISALDFLLILTNNVGNGDRFLFIITMFHFPHRSIKIISQPY